jgi:hypothetical protein
MDGKGMGSRSWSILSQQEAIFDHPQQDEKKQAKRRSIEGCVERQLLTQRLGDIYAILARERKDFARVSSAASHVKAKPPLQGYLRRENGFMAIDGSIAYDYDLLRFEGGILEPSLHILNKHTTMKETVHTLSLFVIHM